MHKLLKLYLYLLPLPVYFFLNGRIYNIDDINMLQTSAHVLPLSFILSIIMGSIVLLKNGVNPHRKHYMSSLDLMWLFSAAIMILSFTVSCFIGHNAANPSSTLLLLYLFPQLFAYIVGRRLAREFDVNTIFRTLWCTSAVFCFIQITYSLCHYGLVYFFHRGVGSIFGIMSIYGLYIFYPAFLAAMFFMGIYLQGIQKYSRILGSFFILGAILISGAREPLAMLMLMFAGYYYYRFGVGRTTRKILFFSFMAVAFVFVFISSGFIDVNHFALYKKIATMVNSRNGLMAGLTGGRLSIWLRFFHYLIQNPSVLLVGSGFSLSKEVPAGTFHSQWFDFIAQGGIFYMLSILSVVVIAIKKSFVLAATQGQYAIIACVLIGFVGVSFFINTNLREPYTSILLWLMIGNISAITRNLPQYISKGASLNRSSNSM